ncbi:MAG TPA: hypothetical protein VGR35_19845 [Tepidisphaeraceae bacterium]|nr:hypothetical protein [Tepidisphaeraceae bacterium]
MPVTTGLLGKTAGQTVAVFAIEWVAILMFAGPGPLAGVTP